MLLHGRQGKQLTCKHIVPAISKSYHGNHQLWKTWKMAAKMVACDHHFIIAHNTKASSSSSSSSVARHNIYSVPTQTT